MLVDAVGHKRATRTHNSLNMLATCRRHVSKTYTAESPILQSVPAAPLGVSDQDLAIGVLLEGRAQERQGGQGEVGAIGGLKHVRYVFWSCLYETYIVCHSAGAWGGQITVISHLVEERVAILLITCYGEQW